MCSSHSTQFLRVNLNMWRSQGLNLKKTSQNSDIVVSHIQICVRYIYLRVNGKFILAVCFNFLLFVSFLPIRVPKSSAVMPGGLLWLVLLALFWRQVLSI